MRAVAEAAFANGREVVAIGRAMDRVIQVAGERGYFDGLPPFRSSDTYGYLPRDKVALLTGSQGEPRAALARVAEDQHPDITLASGDTVILSSRTIPGNEKPVGRIVNNLIRQGIEVITDRTHMVHVSGHPRRGELERLYQWVRPKVAVPVHGEALHLHEHAVLARALGVPEVIEARTGTSSCLAGEAVGGRPGSVRSYVQGWLPADRSGEFDCRRTPSAVICRCCFSSASPQFTRANSSAIPHSKSRDFRRSIAMERPSRM